MSVSIWEGNKAQELINAIKGKNNFPQEVSAALLNCFQNVAWINDNGNTYYNALNEALSNEGGDVTPTVQFDNSFLYRSSDGIVITNYRQINLAGVDTGAASMNDNMLEINVSGSSYVSLQILNRSKPTYPKKVQFKTKFKISSMTNKGSVTLTGAVSGTQKYGLIFNGDNNICRYGNDDHYYETGKTWSLNTWYTAETSLIDNKIKLVVNGETVYEGAPVTFGEESCAFIFNNANGNSIGPVSIDWIDCKWSY